MEPISQSRRGGPRWFGRSSAKAPGPPGNPGDAPGAQPADRREGPAPTAPPGGDGVALPVVTMPRPVGKPGFRARRPGAAIPPLTPAILARLAALGIQPMALAGRLRLVLPVGCSRDFTQTRAILGSGGARDRVDAAIQALMEREAHCDCEVFQALEEPPRCLLWHQPAGRAPGEAARLTGDV